MQESFYTEQQFMIIEALRNSTAKNLPCRRPSPTGSVWRWSPGGLTSPRLVRVGMGRAWLKLTGKRCRYVKAGGCNLHTVPHRPGVIIQMNAAAFL